MSLVMANAQAINRAEYYFNTDPGQGNGTPITVSSPGESVNFSTLIPTTGLPEGFHLLAIRMRDVNGTWTMVDKRGFYIYSGTSNTTDLTAAEYFF